MTLSGSLQARVQPSESHRSMIELDGQSAPSSKGKPVPPSVLGTDQIQTSRLSETDLAVKNAQHSIPASLDSYPAKYYTNDGEEIQFFVTERGGQYIPLNGDIDRHQLEKIAQSPPTPPAPPVFIKKVRLRAGFDEENRQLTTKNGIRYFEHTDGNTTQYHYVKPGEREPDWYTTDPNSLSLESNPNLPNHGMNTALYGASNAYESKENQSTTYEHGLEYGTQLGESSATTYTSERYRPQSPVLGAWQSNDTKPAENVYAHSSQYYQPPTQANPQDYPPQSMSDQKRKTEKLDAKTRPASSRKPRSDVFRNLHLIKTMGLSNMLELDHRIKALSRSDLNSISLKAEALKKPPHCVYRLKLFGGKPTSSSTYITTSRSRSISSTQHASTGQAFLTDKHFRKALLEDPSDSMYESFQYFSAPIEIVKTYVRDRAKREQQLWDLPRRAQEMNSRLTPEPSRNQDSNPWM